jgi:hypothetical protein
MEKVSLIMKIFLTLINFIYSGHMFSFPARRKRSSAFRCAGNDRECFKGSLKKVLPAIVSLNIKRGLDFQWGRRKKNLMLIFLIVLALPR